MKAAELGAVRFITPYQEGDYEDDEEIDDEGMAVRVLVSRIEGLRSCRRCSRLHPYYLTLAKPGDKAPTKDLLSDSWEDAWHQVMEWLPDVPPFLGRRETDIEADASERFFDSRTAAIVWLLEPVPA